MMSHMKLVLMAILLLGSAGALSGCYVAPSPGYSYAPGYYYPGYAYEPYYYGYYGPSVGIYGYGGDWDRDGGRRGHWR